MRIERVDVLIASEPGFHPWRAGLPRRGGQGPAGWLRLGTDDGLVGWSWAADGPGLAALVDRHLREELVGRDPLAREALWQRLWEVNRVAYLSTTHLGVADVALWDLAGKAANLPLYQLLGYARTSLPAYASTITFGSVEEYLDVADQCLELGYRAIKLHAWGDARRDTALATRMREHVGPEVDLMFDGSAGWDLPDAIDVGRVLDDAGYRWYEEPMPEFSIGAYRRLGEAVRTPLLVAEVTEGAHWSTADYIATTSASYVRTSAGFKAGITGAMKIAHLAEAHHIRAEVHGNGLPNEHLCMAIPHTTYYESLIVSNPVRRDPRLTTSASLDALDHPGVGWESVDGLLPAPR